VANYEAMPLQQQLDVINQEVANKNVLTAKGAMWQKASQELTEAGRSLAGATNTIAPEWDDGAGTKFVQVSRRTLTQLDTWKQNIDGAKPHDAIYLVANTLQPTQGIVQEQWRLAMEAVAAAQANAAAGYAARGVGSPALTQSEVNAVMLPFQQAAGRAMNILGGYYEEAARAVTAASGGSPLSNPQAPFNGSTTSSPSTRAASPGGASPDGAAPGGAAPGGAAPGGAAPGGAAPGGAAPGGAAPGGAAGGAPAGGAGADPSLAGGLSGGAPTPTPNLPPGLGTTPPPVPGGTGTVPPFIPPIGGLGGAPRGGGLGGGFGGGGGGGGVRIPGVGLGGGVSGGQTSIPAAGATVSVPTQPTQAGAPAVPQGPPVGGGTAGAGGSGVPPMMPPMGGMGAGMGGGGSAGPGSGAAQRPVNGRPRGDGRTPGLPPVLSGKAGKADANAFAARARRSTVETDVPTTVQLIDEDLWQVDRSAGAVTGRRRAH
jgi:hypothetical protein